MILSIYLFDENLVVMKIPRIVKMVVLSFIVDGRYNVQEKEKQY